MAKRICPLCGGNNTSKILWGMPAWTPELEEDLNSKKIVFGRKHCMMYSGFLQTLHLWRKLRML